MSLNGKSLSFVLAFVAFVAGCVQGGGTTTDPNDPNGPEGPTDENAGMIQGQVLTDELAPIAGAQVGIPAIAAATTTDEAGQYILKNLPAGGYALSAVAIGFQSASINVNVVPGEAAPGNFILSKLPTVGPYHTTIVVKMSLSGQMVKTTPDCMFIQNPQGGGASVAKTCQGTNSCQPAGCLTEVGLGHCNDGSAFQKFGCDFGPEWETLVGEVRWIPTSSATGRGFIFEMLTPNITRSSGHTGSVDQSDKHDFMHLDSRSPIRTVIDRDVLAGQKEAWPGSGTREIPETDWCGGIDGSYVQGSCDWHWRLFPAWCTIHGITGGAAGCDKTGPDFGVMQDQPVELFFTYFMREPAPEGWTALPDF